MNMAGSLTDCPDKSVPAPRSRRRRGRQAERDRVLMTRVGLRIPAVLSFEDWERTGHHLSTLIDSSSWWLGDWLVYGKEHYAGQYMLAIRAAGLQYQTLRNYAWVSRRFELGRRHSRLSFQHHAEVASLPLDEQDWWLDRAEKATWTTKQLRNHIRRARDGGGDGGEQFSVIPRIEISNSRLVWWRRAADHSGVEFSDWLLRALDRAAEQVVSEEIQRRSLAPDS